MKSILKFIVFLVLFNYYGFSDWQECSSGIEGKDLSKAYIYNNELWVGAIGSGIYKTTNQGSGWVLSYSSTYYPEVFALNLNYIFYISPSAGSRINRSINGGVTWENVSSGTSGTYWDLAAYNNKLYLASYGYGIYRSDVGLSWNLYNSGLGSVFVQSIGVKDNYIFAGTRANGISRSLNEAQQWEVVNSGLNSLDVLGFCTYNNGIFAYTDNDGGTSGIYRSTNYGNSWEFKGLTNKDIRSVVNIDNVIFALVYDEGIYRSLDNGESWNIVNEGLTNLKAKHMIKYNNYLYFFAESVNSLDKPAWKRQANEIIGIEQINSEVPNKFVLNQNYPNPFNPTTNISFDIKTSGNVKLTVFNQLGQFVETLVDQDLAPGSYKTDWNAANYPSGVYFYKLETEGMVQTKRMILVK